MGTEMQGLMMVTISDILLEKLGRLLEIISLFLVSEDSLGVLAQTRSLSVICDLVMPAQYVPCIPVWMQTYLQNGE